MERTVKEVLPALEASKEQVPDDNQYLSRGHIPIQAAKLLQFVSPQLGKYIETINTQMQAKGRELTEYRERYNIRLVGEGEAEAKGSSDDSSRDSEGGGSKSGTGVLVS